MPSTRRNRSMKQNLHDAQHIPHPARLLAPHLRRFGGGASTISPPSRVSMETRSDFFPEPTRTARASFRGLLSPVGPSTRACSRSARAPTVSVFLTGVPGAFWEYQQRVSCGVVMPILGPPATGSEVRCAGVPAAAARGGLAQSPAAPRIPRGARPGRAVGYSSNQSQTVRPGLIRARRTPGAARRARGAAQTSAVRHDDRDRGDRQRAPRPASRTAGGIRSGQVA